jgi:hypothetical protein
MAGNLDGIVENDGDIVSIFTALSSLIVAIRQQPMDISCYVEDRRMHY